MTNDHVRLFGVLAFFFLMVTAGFAEAGSFKENLIPVPGDANVLILINAAQARQSEYARQLRAEHGGTPIMDQSILSAPNVERIVTAAKLDLATGEPVWELGVVSTTNEPSLPNLAKYLGGRLDTIDECAALQLPINAYIVALGPRLVGVKSPADRQAIAAWARDARTRSDVSVSEYLKEMAVFPEQTGTDLIMALDLSNVVGVAASQAFLTKSKTLAGKNIDIDELTRLLTSVRGATLGVRILDKPHAKLRIDFGQDAAALTPVAKELILEILANQGATIDELADWNVDVKGNTIFLGGVFSTRGLRRVLSLAEPPLPPLESPATFRPSEPASPGETQAVAQASAKHFKAVSQILDDVGPRRRNRDDKTPGEYGMWLDRSARKIDKLPILNVDEDLLDYSGEVSHGLRNISNQYRGAGVKAGTASANTYYEVWGGYGYGYGYDRYNPRREARKQETATAVSAGITSFSQLDDMTAQIRRLMTQRYKIEF
ncbi:MAG: hypothetical protein GX621_05355 [Pirellulaceae bacterium]|nr:hypothetical protein [Pirellulaceae bacterium]